MKLRTLCGAVLHIAVWQWANGSHPTDANIFGHIVDRQTGEHISYFTVKIPGTSIGTQTDTGGHYVLNNLPVGETTIAVEMIGYKPQTKTVNLEANRSLELNFDVEPDLFILDPVVVTSSKSEQKRRTASSLVGVVTGQLFEMINASSLADGLNFQPGVRVENDCQNCGFTQVRINGLDGHYSQILMNSRPVFSALTGVYGLEQIPANMIDRVEVMRGGGSALFGSSAIGGTVNIITKEPVCNYAEASHSCMSIGCGSSFDNNTTVNASVVNSNTRAGLTVYGQNRIRDGYDANRDGFTEIAQLKTQTLGLRTFLRPDDNLSLSAEYHATHEFRRGGDNLDVPPHNAMVAEQVEHNINGGELNANWWSKSRNDKLNIFVASQNTRRNSYYGSEMDPNAYGRTSDLVVSSGMQWTHSFNRMLFMPSVLTGGVEYNYNYLNDVTVGYDHDVTQRIDVYSGYLQNEWSNERCGILIGCRVDKNSVIGNAIFSPRANVRFNPNSNVVMRLSYSTGFRSPQAYDEDFHVAIVGGERVVTILASGLREESSKSISGSVDLYRTFGDVSANLLVEGFYTNLSNEFALRKLVEPDETGNTVLERYNGLGAYVAGMNLEARVVWNKLQAQAGFTLQCSRYKQPEYWSENPEVLPVGRLFRAPDTYGYMSVSSPLYKTFKLTATCNYTGPMFLQHMANGDLIKDAIVKSPNFFDMTVRLNYEMNLFNSACLELHAGVNNIFNSYQRDFDTGYMRDSGYIYGPSLPRSVFFGIKLHI